MKGKLLAALFIFAAIALAACGAEPAGQVGVEPIVADNVTEPGASPETTGLATVTDDQGAISVAITPLDLSPAAQTLDFEVAMNTHSVDLSMDLAALTTLETDNGWTVTASLWDAEPGGHHVAGVLSFPAMVDGTAVLEGASQLVLTIRGAEAPIRTFTWSIPQP